MSRTITALDPSPFMIFDKLQSGRLSCIKHRVNLMRISYRSKCLSFYNRYFSHPGTVSDYSSNVGFLFLKLETNTVLILSFNHNYV